MKHPKKVSRRQFLARSAALSAAAGALRCRESKPALEGAGELHELAAVDAVAAMRKGELAAVEYAAALLERCQGGTSLNAFITLEPDRVLDDARAADRRRAEGKPLGPLHGLPIPVKDSVNTRDLPTSGGTEALRGFRPREDAPVIRRLLDAGAIVLGKTNLHELSWGWTSHNLAFGPVRNPYDPTRIPGGSSGGTAAAVAARMSPLGLAEDTEGSIRVPAAMCGIAGFRPTTSRYPSKGVMPITPLFDQVGPHARSVADLILFDTAVASEIVPVSPPPLHGLRLGIDRAYFFETLESEVERVTEEALQKLRSAGVELVEVEVPRLAELVEATTVPIQLHDVVPMLKKYLDEFGAGMTFDEMFAQVSEDVRRDFERYALPGAELAVSEEVYRDAVDVHLPALKETMARYFRNHELAALAFPTTLVPPTPIGDTSDMEIRGRTLSFETAVSRNIAPGSTAGIPGLVLPTGLTASGLPVSLELDAPGGFDRELLAIGVAIEQVLGPQPAPPLGRRSPTSGSRGVDRDRR